MHEVRKIALLLSIIAAALCLGLELGSSWFVKAGSGAVNVTALVNEQMSDYSDEEREEALADATDLKNRAEPPPGKSIPALAFLDGFLLLTLLLVAMPLVVPAGLQAKLQGVIVLIVSILALIAAIATIVKSFVALLIMIAMLAAVPFGTIAYMIIYGFFDVTAAVAANYGTLVLRLAAMILLLVAQQKFLRVRSLTILAVTCFAAAWLVQLLHTFPPLFLVSITDALGAVIVGIIAAIWALVFLIFSVVSIVKALKSTAGQAWDAAREAVD